MNREQVRDGAHIFMALIPAIIERMLDLPELDLKNSGQTTLLADQETVVCP